MSDECRVSTREISSSALGWVCTRECVDRNAHGTAHVVVLVFCGPQWNSYFYNKQLIHFKFGMLLSETCRTWFIINRWIPVLHYFSIILLLCPLWSTNPNLLLSSPETINSFRAIRTTCGHNNAPISDSSFVQSPKSRVVLNISRRSIYLFKALLSLFLFVVTAFN